MNITEVRHEFTSFHPNVDKIVKKNGDDGIWHVNNYLEVLFKYETPMYSTSFP